MKYRQEYFGFIYLWRDSEANRFYIGSHYGSTTDSYIASSKWLKSAHKKRPHAFKRRILQYLTTDDKKLLHQMEQAWLDLIKDEELSTSQNVISGTNRYYNMKKQAAGGNGSANKGRSNGVVQTEHGIVGNQTFRWKVTSPDGKEYQVAGLDVFCKEMGISKTPMYYAYRKNQVSTTGWSLSLVDGTPASKRKSGPSR